MTLLLTFVLSARAEELAPLSVPEVLAREGLPLSDLPHRHPIYALFPFDLAPAIAEAWLASVGSDVDVRWRNLSGEPLEPVPEANAPAAALIAYAATLDEPMHLEQEVEAGTHAVQLLWRGDERVLIVRIGPAADTLVTAPADLWARLGGTATGPWTRDDQDAVWTATHTLEDDWLAAIAGVDWERLDRGEGWAAVRWRRRAPAYRLYATPGCMDGTAYGPARIGPPEAPFHLGVETAIHELGHVVEGASWGAAVSSGGRGRFRCAKKATKAMVEAYGTLLGARSPSDYGADRDTYPGEGFAEGFAFYVLHPDYLQRVAPDVYGWFEARGPLVESQARYDACMGLPQASALTRAYHR
ncbi:MAG: hypothetical protein KC656_34725, partial [Myxococcales bacterium]|nr:hypothetical protein [Myxococcales bacterium]